MVERRESGGRHRDPERGPTAGEPGSVQFALQAREFVGEQLVILSAGSDRGGGR